MNAVTGGRWTKKDVHQILSKGSWFGTLPENLKDTILAQSKVLGFPSGTTLYKVGDPVDGLYAALEGDIRAYVPDDNGEMIFLRAYGPGSWFGYVPLFCEPAFRSMELRCESPVTTLFLPKQTYREMTDSDPVLYRAFVQLAGLHLRYAARLLVESRSEAPRRTARALLRLCRMHGITAEGGMRLAINLSQADLASLVGVSRQYINELVARWEKEGILRWKGKSQPLLDPEKLRSLLGPRDQWIVDDPDWVQI